MLLQDFRVSLLIKKVVTSADRAAALQNVISDIRALKTPAARNAAKLFFSVHPAQVMLTKEERAAIQAA
jgi:hypothetical protein